MNKKVMNGQVKTVLKNLEAIYDKTMKLMDESIWITEGGPSAELVEQREEIEAALSSIVVLLIGFAGACEIDLDEAIEKRMKEIHKALGLSEEGFDVAFNGSSQETETTV